MPQDPAPTAEPSDLVDDAVALLTEALALLDAAMVLQPAAMIDHAINTLCNCAWDAVPGAIACSGELH